MSSSFKRPRIAVVGSINMDLVLKCHKFPRPGETITARSFHQIPGGKGANQAVAAARAGAATHMIGRVGDDGFGQSLVESLITHGVDCSGVMKTPEVETGLAFITVNEMGENSIVIAAGANGQVSTKDVTALKQSITSCDAIMLQLEVPYEVVLQVIRIAREANVRVILDPAPAPAPAESTMELMQVDLLCPNESEAEFLAGAPVCTLEQIHAAADILHRRGVRNVVITLGERGAYVLNSEGGRLIPPFPTNAVDTTAAGDAFIGALATRWIETENLDEAVQWGNAAGAIAASRLGAQTSMGTREEIETLWRSLA